MSHTIIYSAEELRELLNSLSPLVTNHSKPLPLTAPLSSERATLVSELTDRENLSAMLERPLITCVVPLRSENRAEDAVERVQALDRVIVSNGSSVILANHDYKTRVAHYSLNQSSERWQVIDEFGAFVRGLNCFNDFPEIAMTACSELVTNAFYNAPRNENGDPLQTDRRIPVTLNKPVDVSYGQDDTHVWLEVRDPFGTFSRDSLLRSLLKSSDGHNLAVNMENGGAGIGLYMVFRWAAQLMFSFRPNHETCVMIKLLKTKRHKIFDSQRAILELVQY